MATIKMFQCSYFGPAFLSESALLIVCFFPLSWGTMIFTSAVLLLPESSVAVVETVYSRPSPLPDRSARSCNEIIPVSWSISGSVQSGDLFPSPVPSSGLPKTVGDPDSYSIPDQVQALEIKLIKKALHKSSGNKHKAANLLCITRQGLYKKIKRYQIDISDTHLN